MTAPADVGEELRSEINVTPLVDVMLVLLVIFMVVTPMLRLELPIEVPSATTAREVVSSDRRLTISVEADGTTRLDGTLVTRNELGAALTAALAGRADEAVFLEADRATAYAAGVEVMDTARAAGVSRLGVITAQP